jgi:hypothetical protein
VNVPPPIPRASGRGTTQVVGHADDGGVVVLHVSTPVLHLLDDRWPPEGLTAVASDHATGGVPPADLTLSLAVDFVSGRAVATVDGHESPGGWERIESELALFAADRRHGWVAVHAAVIAHDDGVLLVPGTSGAGKSTLCVAAAEAGATVMSDEYAMVQPSTGLVRGWLRPVRVRRPGGVDRLDLAVPTDPLPVRLIAAVAHRPGAGVTWNDASAADAVVHLMANTVCARSRPDESLDAALAVARSAKCVAGDRGEAADAIVALLALMDERGSRPVVRSADGRDRGRDATR